MVRGATMRAERSGPDGKNLTASKGKNPHEITKVKTKKVMSGWRLTADVEFLLFILPENRGMAPAAMVPPSDLGRICR
jgi:hypothetical protein